MSAAVLAALQAAIALTPQAIALWETMKPILSEGREPTEAEWIIIHRLRDEVHAAVQAQ